MMQVSKEKWYLDENMLEPYEPDLMVSYNADTWEAKACAVKQKHVQYELMVSESYAGRILFPNKQANKQ